MQFNLLEEYMFYRNENLTYESDNNNQSDANTQFTQPLDDTIDPMSSMYDTEQFNCPFDMYRLNTDADPMPNTYHSMPHGHYEHPPYPMPIPYPYYPNMYYVTHYHHHYYHNNRPTDGKY
jgi:hypothetical protein